MSAVLCSSSYTSHCDGCLELASLTVWSSELTIDLVHAINPLGSNQIVQVLRPRWHLDKVSSRFLVYSDQISLSISIFSCSKSVTKWPVRFSRCILTSPQGKAGPLPTGLDIFFSRPTFNIRSPSFFNRAISWRNTFLLHYLTEKIVLSLMLRIIYVWFDECHYVSNQ